MWPLSLIDARPYYPRLYASHDTTLDGTGTMIHLGYNYLQKDACLSSSGCWQPVDFRSFLIGRAPIAITGEAEWPTSDKGSKPKSPACDGTLAH
jgi:hypothetical protein